jgi:sarcosine oxidase/L-pipecolate oxidase
MIDFVPDMEGVIAVSGDSNHGFKMMPVVGKWVREVLENGKQDHEQWKWKENKTGVELEPRKEIGEIECK